MIGHLLALVVAAGSEPLLPVQVDGRWGYIDTSGQMVIAPKFRYAHPFSEGLAAVYDKEWTYIDTSANRVFALPLDPRPTEFHDGRARLCYSRDYMPEVCVAIDQTGKTVWSGKSEQTVVGDFHGGMAPIQAGPLKLGYIDRDGKEVVPPTYFSATPFGDGAGVVGVSGGFRFIEPDGKVRFFLPAVAARAPREGRAAFRPSLKRGWGFIAAEGGIVIEPRYQEVGDFSGGLATFRSGGHWGFLDTEGKVAIAPRFTLVQSFSEGAAAATEVGFDGYCAPPTPEPECRREERHRWGYIDQQGKWLIKPQYDEAGPFSGGVARTKAGGEQRFIDKRGHTFWPKVPAVLIASDLEGKGGDELKRMRNDIYARHGWVFKDAALADYFSKQDWYKPDPSFDPSTLSDDEKNNVALIKAAEKAAR